MIGDTQETNPAGKMDVQLVSRKEQIPTAVNVKSFTPREDRRGFRMRQYFFETEYQLTMVKQLHYEVWKKHPWIRALVNKIANIASAQGFYIKYVGEGEPDKEQQAQIYNFFLYPNYQESFQDIARKTFIQLKIYAESFWEVVKVDGHPADFWTLDGTVVPLVDEHGIHKEPAFKQKVLANEAFFKYDEIIHFKQVDPGGRLRPSSDLESLDLTVLVDIYAMQLNRQSFVQGVRKGKLFLFPENTGEEQMKRNRAQIDTLHTGVQGSFSAFIALEGECKVEDLILTKSEMEARDLREYLRDEMAAVIGTPLSKVGIGATEVKESEYIDKSFFSEEIQPIMDLVENTINRYLDMVGIFDYRFKYRKYPVRDLKEYARLIDVLKKHGLASMNEIRELIGLTRVEKKGADIPFMLTRDGTVVFPTEITEEKTKLEAIRKQELGQGFSFKFPKRKIIRKGLPAAREEEEASEDFDDEEEENTDPFP